SATGSGSPLASPCAPATGKSSCAHAASWCPTKPSAHGVARVGRTTLIGCDGGVRRLVILPLQRMPGGWAPWPCRAPTTCPRCPPGPSVRSFACGCGPRSPCCEAHLLLASVHPPSHRSSPPHLPLVRAGSPRETRAADRWREGRTVPRIILAPV